MALTFYQLNRFSLWPSVILLFCWSFCFCIRIFFPACFFSLWNMRCLQKIYQLFKMLNNRKMTATTTTTTTSVATTNSQCRHFNIFCLFNKTWPFSLDSTPFWTPWYCQSSPMLPVDDSSWFRNDDWEREYICIFQWFRLRIWNGICYMILNSECHEIWRREKYDSCSTHI